MTAYYNEFDPFAAAWLRELMKENLIAPGDVDERSIKDVRGNDLEGYTQHHFFAGIGGWSCALRLAGWPDDKPVWTGSCPCQPFSAAGKRKGTADERHLWPEFQRLIGECEPSVVFGEQVASKDGRLWLSGVRADVEALGYAVGAADLCAAGVGAPHIRQRLFWVADAEHTKRRAECEIVGEAYRGDGLGRCGDIGGMADAGNAVGWPLYVPGQDGCHGSNTGGQEAYCELGARSQVQPWGRAVFIPCADGKARRIESGIQPLAHGAIVPQIAAEFIAAYSECCVG